MKLGVLFSGGKDSMLALDIASEYHDIACLVTLDSANPDSYMFHTPAIDNTAAQATAMGIPQLVQETKGEKEVELEDLKKALSAAKTKYGIEGVVTGALDSMYQASRIQRVCYKLGLTCFNPLWQKRQEDVLKEIAARNYNVIVAGVNGYPLEEDWLGRALDDTAVDELLKLQKDMGFNPAGEGGEIETYVLWAPRFVKTIKITDMKKTYSNHSGRVHMTVEVSD